MKGTSTIIFATSCTARYLKEFECAKSEDTGPWGKDLKPLRLYWAVHNLHLCLCSQFWISSSLSEVLSLNLIFNFREVDNVVGKQLWWVGYWWVNTVLVWGTKKEVCFQYPEMNRHDWWNHSAQRWKNWRAFTISTYSDQQDVTRVLWRYDSFSITT